MFIVKAGSGGSDNEELDTDNVGGSHWSAVVSNGSTVVAGGGVYLWKYWLL